MISRRLFWVGTIVAAWQFLGCSKLSEPFESTAFPTGTVVFQQTHRKVFQHSVIPGGVYSAAELARARRIDPVVADHYSDFGSNARVTRLAQDELVYISYRKADKVFWSTKKHRVCAGEAVITDGKNTARSRCGNRFSKIPRLPTAKTEPTELAMNTPEVPTPIPGVQSGAGGPLDPAYLPAPPPDPGTGPLGNNTTPLAKDQSPVGTGASPADKPITTGANTANPTGTAPASFFPAVSPYFGGPGGLVVPNSTNTGTPTTTGTTTTTAAIPEPANIFLTLTGVSLLIILRRRRHKMGSQNGVRRSQNLTPYHPRTTTLKTHF